MNNSKLQEMRDIYSDFYKEAHGVRPRHDTSDWTLEKFEQVFAQLARTCEENEAERRGAEAAAIADLNARIAKLIKIGAADEATAIRWIADAEGAADDPQYLCYKLGLPYGHFNGVLTYAHAAN